jgi:hypothetical protein
MDALNLPRPGQLVQVPAGGRDADVEQLADLKDFNFLVLFDIFPDLAQTIAINHLFSCRKLENLRLLPIRALMFQLL